MNHSNPIFIALPAGDIPYVFPMGTIDLIKRAQIPIQGHYSWNLSDERIRQAPIAIMPIHWYFSLQPGIELSHRLKSINPKIKIISGGFTAGAYPEYIFQHSKIDYILRGDAEVPFLLLMQRLLDNEDPRNVPNLSWPEGKSSLSYQVDAKTLGESDNRDVSWFPEFEKVALKSQKLSELSMIFPWVVVSRGCKFHCPECFASPEAQQLLAGRKMVKRPAEAVHNDLAYWSSRKDIRYCHFNSDFISTLGMDWTENALQSRYDLTAYYEWYRLPKEEELTRLVDSFSSMVLGFFFRPGAQCLHRERDTKIDQSAQLSEIVRFCRSQAKVILYVTPHLAATQPEYFSQTNKIQASGEVDLKLIDETIVPPIASQNEEERKKGFDALLFESKKAMPKLKIQHAILSFAITRMPILFKLLWKISLIRVNIAFRLASRNKPD